MTDTNDHNAAANIIAGALAEAAAIELGDTDIAARNDAWLDEPSPVTRQFAVTFGGTWSDLAFFESFLAASKGVTFTITDDGI